MQQEYMQVHVYLYAYVYIYVIPNALGVFIYKKFVI